MYRFNPEEYAKGESGLTIDSVTPGPDNSGTNGSSELTASVPFNIPEPVRNIQEFVMNEDRYADLNLSDSNEAGILRPELQKDCNQITEALKKQAKQ